jgi:hypothetical protein
MRFSLTTLFVYTFLLSFGIFALNKTYHLTWDGVSFIFFILFLILFLYLYFHFSGKNEQSSLDKNSLKFLDRPREEFKALDTQSLFLQLPQLITVAKHPQAEIRQRSIAILEYVVTPELLEEFFKRKFDLKARIQMLWLLGHIYLETEPLALYSHLLEEEYWLIRLNTLQLLQKKPLPVKQDLESQIQEIAQKDPHKEVRNQAKFLLENSKL